MATKGIKRTAAQTGKVAGPYAKVAKGPSASSMFNGLVDAVQSAEGVPEPCKNMLVAMIPSCFGERADERHEFQNVTVRMVGQLVDRTLVKMRQDIEAAEEAVIAAEATKGSHESTKTDSESKLDAASAVALEKRCALQRASKFVSDKESKKAKAQAVQGKGEAELDITKKEKELYEEAFEGHFKSLRDKEHEVTQAKKLYNTLEPLVAKLGVEDSMVSAMASACVLAPASRRNFDKIVLAELEKSLVDHLAMLAETLQAGASASAERAAAVDACQQELEVAQEAREAAADELSEAEASLKEATMKLAADEDAKAQFLPVYRQTVSARDSKVTSLRDFEQWNVWCLKQLRGDGDDAANETAIQASKVEPQIEGETAAAAACPDVGGA
jgi:hypothetical protein